MAEKGCPWSCPRESGLYVYGDPATAIRSLYRRGYHRHQVANLKGTGIKIKDVDLPETAAEYLNRGDDGVFGFLDHMAAWMGHCPNIAAVQLQDFTTDRRLLVAQHLGVDAGRLTGFSLKPRLSAVEDSNSSSWFGYYKDMARSMEAMATLALCKCTDGCRP